MSYNFRWDSYSDQPYPISERKFKKEIYKKARVDLIKTVFTTLFLAPIIALKYIFTSNQQPHTQDIFAVGINANKDASTQLKLLQELDIKKILIRIPLKDIQNLDKYKNFTKTFKDYDILITIIQDRKHIEDETLLKQSISKIFQTLLPYCNKYQIGNAINRKKWEFFKMSEYMSFFYTIQKLRDKEYPNIKLIGSSVIDFEYYFSIRTLFNFFKIKYDIFSTLLYVDRRGDPQNTQINLDLFHKIKLLYTILTLSPKTNNKIIITETNWPRSGTSPYAPTSEKECVDEEFYNIYMFKYYLISMCTGLVDTIYWHQLLAPGYGLVDNRDDIQKYQAFDIFKNMITLFTNAKILKYKLNKTHSHIKLENDTSYIDIYWGNNIKQYIQNQKIYTIDGKIANEISNSPIYTIEQK